MPPAIEEDGVDTISRGGSASVGSTQTQQRYKSPYISAGENHPPNGTSSSSRNSGAQRPFGAVEPSFDITKNPAFGPPRYQQAQHPAYISSGPPSQIHPNRPIPYQVQRSPQFLAQSSAQSALGSYPYKSVPTYHNNTPTMSSHGSGHGHDFAQPQAQLQYHAQSRLLSYPATQQPPSSSYSSPYLQGPAGSQSFLAQPHNSPPSNQLATPDSRATQHRPSTSQAMPRNMESPGSSTSSSRVALSIPAKRGRPSGKHIETSRLAIEIDSAPPAKRRGRPSRNSTAGPAIESVSVAVADSNILSKRRGRPFKTAESAAKAKAKANGEYIPKKRGRPAKNSDQVDIPIPLAEFVEFGCEWKGCSAKLHNLEALRMHITAVHGVQKQSESDSMEWVCAWKKCGMRVEVDESDDSDIPNREGKKAVFEIRKEWEKHVEEMHLKSYSWHLGDGPRSSGSAPLATPKPIDPWLLNGKGEQVTPSIIDIVIEGGFAKHNNQRRWAKEKRRLHLEEETELPAKGSFMKTKAQVVQEERANDSSRTGSDEPEANDVEDVEIAVSNPVGNDGRDEGDDQNDDQAIEKGQANKLKAQYTIEDDMDSGADEMLLD